MRVLYLSQNGISDHIGQSQIAPYLFGLSELGHEFHVLSAEKKGGERIVQQYASRFAQTGIQWSKVCYRNVPPILGQLWTQYKMRRMATRLIKREHFDFVHCRGFPPALIGDFINRKYGVPFLFDFRDFYADGGLYKERGLRRAFYAYLKRREGALLHNANQVVCLTDVGKDILTKWYFPLNGGDRLTVIPCCADFQHFDGDGIPLRRKKEIRDRLRLSETAFILIYLGSLGTDYLLREMVALFRQLLQFKPDSVFLFISNNGRDLVEKEFDAQGVDKGSYRFVSSSREEVPAYLSLADLSVIFIRADVSKAGCSPTKLAELFACNIPVIANSGVGDLDRIIDMQKNGSVVVSDFRDETLQSAIEQVLVCKKKGGVDIRLNSREFSLEVGVCQYDDTYCNFASIKRPE